MQVVLTAIPPRFDHRTTHITSEMIHGKPLTFKDSRQIQTSKHCRKTSLTGPKPCHCAMPLVSALFLTVLGPVFLARSQRTGYEADLQRFINETKALTELDLKCEEMLGLSTTTSTTLWWVTAGDRKLLQQRILFREKTRASGKQLGKDFASWLLTRLLVILCTLTLGMPLLVAICYRCSHRFKKWPLDFKTTILFAARNLGHCFSSPVSRIESKTLSSWLLHIGVVWSTWDLYIYIYMFFWSLIVKPLVKWGQWLCPWAGVPSGCWFSLSLPLASHGFLQCAFWTPQTLSWGTCRRCFDNFVDLHSVVQIFKGKVWFQTRNVANHQMLHFGVW